MLENIKEFYRKNRLYIIIGLAFLLLMQICSRGGRVNTSQRNSSTNEITENIGSDGELKPLNELYYEERQAKQQRNPEFYSLFLLMGLVLLVYVGIKRGWIQKLSPSIVWVSIGIRRNKSSKERMATISIQNSTKESLTFNSPIIAFAAPFKKARRFKIKGGVDNVFPLTLMPGTVHKLTINIDTFRNKAGISNGHSWVKVEVDSGLKTYGSIWKYLF